MASARRAPPRPEALPSRPDHIDDAVDKRISELAVRVAKLEARGDEQAFADERVKGVAIEIDRLRGLLTAAEEQLVDLLELERLVIKGLRAAGHITLPEDSAPHTASVIAVMRRMVGE